MSALDDFRKAKQALHEIEHGSYGHLEVRFERPIHQPAGSSNREWLSLSEGSELFQMAIELLRARLERLRVEAEAEARQALASELQP